ncbi:alcohol dehydrogenase catalytic domain-containing protein [bacterium]|nr:alcohol dehydrogenase catalytic domain-containing protein [candidate division CSSED10-310 bacterium]
MAKQEMMWALVFDKQIDDWERSKGFRKMEVPKPVLDEHTDPDDSDNVLIKVIYAGFCGSDRGIWFRNSFKGAIFDSLKKEKKSRRIIGHELLGEIVQVGSRARRLFGFKPKDIVTTESHIICGSCYQCRIGDTHVCADDIIIGISRDGCFAEYIKLPAKSLWRTDKNKISLKVGAVQEPFGNAVHCCTKVDLRGKTLAIFGCGTIGLFAVLVARALGAGRIIGIEPLEKHREMALALGADEVIALEPDARKSKSWQHDRKVVDAVLDCTNGIGADVAMEMSGFNSSLNNAIKSVRRGGDVVLFGLKSGNSILQDFDRLIVNGISLHSVIGRQIFRTWFITKNLLESKQNGIQDKILNVILAGGEGTVFHIDQYTPDLLEEAITAHPKVILQFS